MSSEYCDILITKIQINLIKKQRKVLIKHIENTKH
jgi:hypothetical protein